MLNTQTCTGTFITQNLIEANIQIELFPLKKPAIKNFRFNVNLFYDQIISFDEDEINNGTIDTGDKIMDLQSRLKAKEYKKRAIG